MTSPSSSAVLTFPPTDQIPSNDVIDLTSYGRARVLAKNDRSYKRKYDELLDTILGHEEEKELLEKQERDNRARSRAQKRLMVDHLKIVESTNDELTTENVALTSRVQALERDLAAREKQLSAVRTAYTCRVERLTARNKELENDLENSLREIDEAQRSLKCPICASAEANKVTGCGHVFCAECLELWEKKWYQEVDPDGDSRQILKGILKCPVDYIDTSVPFAVLLAATKATLKKGKKKAKRTAQRSGGVEEAPVSFNDTPLVGAFVEEILFGHNPPDEVPAGTTLSDDRLRDEALVESGHSEELSETDQQSSIDHKSLHRLPRRTGTRSDPQFRAASFNRTAIKTR